MGSRYRFPFAGFETAVLNEMGKTPPPILRKPQEVNFRPSANLDEIVTGLTKYSRVQISAAVGAGKSTILPRLIAQRMDCPVVYAVPSEFAAQDHYDYLSALYPGEVSLAVDEGHVIAKKGVTIASCPWVAGTVVIQKILNPDNKAPLGECVLFVDEVHEPEGYSDFVRRVGPSFPGVRSFMEASATHDAARIPKREPKGVFTTEFYKPERVDTWSPGDTGKPWSFTSFEGNVLIFIDSDTVARKLVSAYGAYGLTSYRLSSKMDRGQFRSIFKEMRDDRNGRMLVMVADYTFRNALTFSVTSIIDSARVRVPCIEGTDLKFSYRPLYELEKYQTGGRGARTEGSKCVHWIPQNTEFPSMQSVLEPVEAEISALLLRLYGYSVPVEMASMVKTPLDKVPKNISQALQSFQPLALLPGSEWVPLVAPKPSVDTVAVASVVDMYAADGSPVVEVADLFAKLNYDEQPVVSKAVSADLLSELQQVVTAARTLESGYYYYCAQAERNGSLGTINWKALLQSIHDQPVLITGYSPEMRKDAVAILLEVYNEHVLIGAAVSRINAHKDALVQSIRMYPETTKPWVDWLLDKANTSKMLSASLLKAVGLCRSPNMVFTHVPPDTGLEEKQARQLVAPLLSAIEKAEQAVDTQSFFDGIGSRMGHDPGPAFPAIGSSDGVDTAECSVKWRPVVIAGATYHSATVSVKNPLHWTFDDYVDAVSSLVQNRGVVVESMCEVKIDAPGINDAEVLQAIRDRTKKGKFTRYAVATRTKSR